MKNLQLASEALRLVQAIEKAKTPDCFPAADKRLVRRYVATVLRRDLTPAGAEDCEYGHFGCSLLSGGLCVDRSRAALGEED